VERGLDGEEMGDSEVEVVAGEDVEGEDDGVFGGF